MPQLLVARSFLADSICVSLFLSLCTLLIIVFFYRDVSITWYRQIYQLVGCLFQTFDNNIGPIRINLPVCMDGKIPQNGEILSICDWLRVMLLLVVRERDVVMTANVPMQVMAYSVINTYVLCCSKFRTIRSNVVNDIIFIIAKSPFGVCSIVQNVGLIVSCA